MKVLGQKCITIAEGDIALDIFDLKFLEIEDIPVTQIQLLLQP
jgi:hypothetical protein